MFADEGIGIHFCKLLEENHKFTHSNYSLDFVDGDASTLQLSYIIVEYGKMIMLDCIDADGSKIGNVLFFSYDAAPKKINWSGSMHEVEMLQTLQYMELVGGLPYTQILACVPKRIKSISFTLSQETVSVGGTMEKTLLEYLAKEGFSYEEIASHPL